MGRMLLMAWAALASFADAPDAPRLGYERAVFADACLAPDYVDAACRLARHADGLSASAALLPVHRPQPQSQPRLGYRLAELIEGDALVTYSEPEVRVSR